VGESRGERTGARKRVGQGMWLRVAGEDALVARVRRGDAMAFEELYDRHARELLSFCGQMLGSRHDAEDAVQSTFASAYRALLRSERSVSLRPWLYAIARNECLTVLRRHRPVDQVDDALAAREDPVAQVEQREDLRRLVADLLRLPEPQRAALVLTQLHGFTHTQTGDLLGVRPEQVKAYVYQARSTLRQRRWLGGLVPLAPSALLRRRVLHAALDGSGGTASSSAAAGSATVASGELVLAAGKALVAKVMLGVAALGAGAAVGTAALGGPARAHVRSHATAAAYGPSVSPGSHATAEKGGLAAPSETASQVASGVLARPSAGAVASGQSAQQPARAHAPAGGSARATDASAGATAARPRGGSQTSGEATPPKAPHVHEGGKGDGPAEHGKSEVPHGKNEVPHGNGGGERGGSREGHGKSSEAHEHGKSGEAHGGGSSEAPRGQGAHGEIGEGEAAHGNGRSESAPGHSGGEETHGGNGESEEVHGNGRSEQAHAKAEASGGASSGEGTSEAPAVAKSKGKEAAGGSGGQAHEPGGPHER
jgi:RNA polymerase sigma factor (sigma-70 family)